jgi:hypothetical protein
MSEQSYQSSRDYIDTMKQAVDQSLDKHKILAYEDAFESTIDADGNSTSNSVVTPEMINTTTNTSSSIPSSKEYQKV